MSDNDCRRTDRTSGRILIWDAEGAPDEGFELTVLWRGFESNPEFGNRVVSIPQLVEETADELRSRYLAWVHSLGEVMVRGRSVAEHLLIRQELSFWWMASPAQKFNVSGISLVSDAIKMLALEKLLARQQVQSLVLRSSNTRLAECLAAYCEKIRLHFCWQRNEQPKFTATSMRAVYQKLPPVLRALISLGKFFVARVPRTLGSRNHYAHLGEVSFFDVLVHLNKRALISGRFESNYWGPLVEKLSDRGVRVNWLYMFYPYPAARTCSHASNAIKRFQRDTVSGEM